MASNGDESAALGVTGSGSDANLCVESGGGVAEIIQQLLALLLDDLLAHRSIADLFSAQPARRLQEHGQRAVPALRVCTLRLTQSRGRGRGEGGRRR